MTWEADAHAEEATRVRQTHMQEKKHVQNRHMQKRKACEAHMQEDLAMIGLGFW
jgi:hypothetical protein